jgi:hypothetical protein
MTESEHHQMQLERMQMLEDALERAEAGIASEGDWNIIRFECSAPKRPTVILQTISIGENHEFHSV